MPKFNVSAEFGIYTEVEYDGYADFGDSNEALDYENSSYFGSETISLTGGEVTFKVEADDEDDARRKADLILSDGYEVEDNSGITWTVQDVSFTIEADEMSRDEAFVIVRRLLDRLVGENHITAEEREALDLVIQDS